MAPFKRLRTYQNFNKNTTRSENVFNDLLAKNISKRFESSTEISDKSESTFDKLLKTDCYNKVPLKKFPENIFNADSQLNESSMSTSELKGSKEKSKRSKDSQSSSCSGRSPIQTRNRSKSKKESLQSDNDPIGIHDITDTSDQDEVSNLEKSMHSEENIKDISISCQINYRLPEPEKRCKSKTPPNRIKQLSDLKISAIENINIGAIDTLSSVNNSPDFCGFTSPDIMESSKKSFQCNSSLTCDKMIFSNETTSFATPARPRHMRKFRRKYSHSSVIHESQLESPDNTSQCGASGPNLDQLHDVSSILDRNSSLMLGLNIKHVIPLQKNIHLVSSTPLPTEKKSNESSCCLPSNSENKENCSPLQKSYETINRWNFKCPSPNSFAMKISGINNKSKNISRKREKNMGRRKVDQDRKFRENPAVIIKRNRKLESILQTQQDLSLLKKFSGSCSMVTPLELENISRKSKFSRNFSLKELIILLTPLSSKTNYNEKGKTEKPSIENSHICSEHCKCFRRQPRVLLNKFDCFMQHENPRKSIEIIDIQDSSFEDKHGESVILLGSFIVRKGSEQSDSQTNSSNLKMSNKSSPVSSRTRSSKSLSFSSYLEEDKIRDCYVLLERNKKDFNRSDNNFVLISDSSEFSISNAAENNNSSCKESEASNAIESLHESNRSSLLEPHSITKNTHNNTSSGHDGSQKSSKNSSSSDIIESSIVSPIDIAKLRSTFVDLAPGKKFRRSMVVWKNKLSQNKSERKETVTPNRRTSVKIIPVSEKKGRVSDIGRYALNNTGYGYASVRETTLEDIEKDFQNLFTSLNDRTNAPPLHGNVPITNYTAKEIVLRKCGQTEPLNFEECYPPSSLQHCQKIGEGVFGEVFMFRETDGSTTVMKIIPIEGHQMVNLEKQKTFEEIISEIVISTELSNLRNTKRNNTDGFNEVKKVRCIKGCYPERLMYLWELYDENKKSENDSPEIFDQNQLYIVLELSNGGTDLESYMFNNAEQALAVFKQITCALAVAENELMFEHRDLHWGNVLVTNTRDKHSTFILDGKEILIQNKGTKATIIDFTLSRIEQDGVIIFNDMASDVDLFTAKGDYQFEIYRLMQKHNENSWQDFKPYTNILWLHYILDKAINSFRYKNVKTKVHKQALKELRSYQKEILNCDSAGYFVCNNFIQ